MILFGLESLWSSLARFESQDPGQRLRQGKDSVVVFPSTDGIDEGDPVRCRERPGALPRQRRRGTGGFF